MLRFVRLAWIVTAVLPFFARAEPAPAPDAGETAPPAPAGAAPALPGSTEGAQVPGSAATPASRATALAPSLRPPLHVKDLDHLSALVRLDAEVDPAARKLASRRSVARGVGGLGLAVSAGLLLYGLVQWEPNADQGGGYDPNRGKSTRAERAMFAGLIGFPATGLLAALISPRRGELLGVVDAWNTRHPDQPLTLDTGSGTR